MSILKSDLTTKSLFITIVGNPNVGKSSLLNAIIGQKLAIVSHKPQTTRNKILGIFTDENIQLVFTDTPGIHVPNTHLGKYMVEEAEKSITGVDACIHVIEAGKPISDIDEKLINKFKNSKIPVVLVINKIDLLSDKTIIANQIEKMMNLFDYNAIIPISAKTNNGVDRLVSEIKKLSLPSIHFYPSDEFTDQPERALISEIVREKILRVVDKEIPHGIAVVTEKVKERNSTITDVSCVIYCERESHKGIVIGKNGDMLKRIGSYARQDIENLLDKKVNLKLWVKVKEGWRNRDNILKNLGYHSE